MSAPYELSVTRHIAAPPQIVWRAFVEHGTEWFTPRPWTTPEVQYDLYPGGRANIRMRSPEGEEHEYLGVMLAVIMGRRLVCTGAMTEGWIPNVSDMNFVRIDTFDPEGEGTRYTALARHWDEAGMKKHAEMGFAEGWGIVTDQLAEVAEALAQKV